MKKRTLGALALAALGCADGAPTEPIGGPDHCKHFPPVTVTFKGDTLGTIDLHADCMGPSGVLKR